MNAPWNIVTGILLLFIIVGMKPDSCSQQTRPTANLRGKLLWVEGNMMPGPGVSLPDGKPVRREVHVFEATGRDEITSSGNLFSEVMSKRVKIIYSNDEGYFEAFLEPGKYSLFIKEPDGKYFASTMDDKHYCPVLIEKDKVAEIEIKIDYKAFY